MADGIGAVLVFGFTFMSHLLPNLAEATGWLGVGEQATPPSLSDSGSAGGGGGGGGCSILFCSSRFPVAGAE